MSQPAESAPTTDASAPAADAAPAPAAPAADAAAAARADIEREYSAKLQRALGAHTKAERERIAATGRAQELESKFKDVDVEEYQRLKGYLKDPSLLFKDGHLTAEHLGELQKKFLSGDLEALSGADRAAAEARKEAEDARREIKELREAREAEQAEQAFRADVKAIQGVITAEDSDYPMLAAFDRAEMVTRAIHDHVKATGETPTNEQVHEYLASQETAIVSDLVTALRTDAGLRAIKNDKELRASVLKALAVEEGEENAEQPEQAQQESSDQGQSSAGGPRTVTNDQVAEVRTRTTQRPDVKGRRANREAAIALLKRQVSQREGREGRV